MNFLPVKFNSLPRARVRAHKRDRARSRMTGDLANLLRGNSYGVKFLKYPHKILPISNKQISNFLCGSGDLADLDLQNKQDLISKILRSWSGDLVTGDLDQAKILRSWSGKISKFLLSITKILRSWSGDLGKRDLDQDKNFKILISKILRSWSCQITP